MNNTFKMTSVMLVLAILCRCGYFPTQSPTTAPNSQLKAQKPSELYSRAIKLQYGSNGNSDITTARNLLTEAANQGSDAACLRLYEMYSNGDYGVPMDKAQARGWLSKAADLKNPLAMVWKGDDLLQNVTLFHQDIPQANRLGQQVANILNDPKTDLHNPDVLLAQGFLHWTKGGHEIMGTNPYDWFKAAADMGDIRAMTYLGVYCLYHQQNPERRNIGFQYLKKAAELGECSALNRIASVYYYNDPPILTQVDYQIGFRYLKLAERYQSSEAYSFLSHLYSRGTGLPQDYIRAFEYAQKGTDLNNDKSLVSLGTAYLKGQGVAKDPAKALILFHRAAMAQNSDAYYHLYQMYHLGIGTKPDTKLALEFAYLAAQYGDSRGFVALGKNAYKHKQYDFAKSFFTDAAKLNNAEASYLLGLMYLGAIGTQKNIPEGVKLLTFAAESDFPAAQNELGLLYQNGTGVTQDYVIALTLFQSSVKKGYYLAAINLGEMYGEGLGVAKDRSQRASLLLLAAEHDTPEAMLAYAKACEEGDGVPINKSLALSWYQKAASANNLNAIIVLANKYYFGHDVPKNKDKAHQLYVRGADLKDANCLFCLGLDYTKGDGVAIDTKKAFGLYMQAYELGNGNAAALIGNFYENGISVPRSPQMALEWYQKAIEMKSILGNVYAGQLYQNGALGYIDFEKAKSHFQAAAEKGDPTAQEWLSKHAATNTPK